VKDVLDSAIDDGDGGAEKKDHGET
jgi:hypothetical protein